ncbi:MAG: sugar phosphate isomerase/epimerase [Phycisphaerae bacterium]|nr:sugar phosphate isomerase/epimerase [Phycisphaerae bacterium]
MSIDKVAAQLYTLRDLCKTPADIAETLKKVRQIGYPAVQVSGIGPIDPKELRKLCDDLGLVICASHTGYDDLMNKLTEVIAKHQVWGCTQIAVPVTPDKMRNQSGYVQFAREMSKVGQRLAKEGITLSYHNHSFEFQKYGGKTGLELIYDNSDPQYFQGEIDTYWVQHGGGDPAGWCRRLKNRLPLVHLKDYGIVDNKPTYMEIGEGNLNWAAILPACRDAGTQWYPVEQDVCPGDPIESMKISFENLKRLFKQA